MKAPLQFFALCTAAGLTAFAGTTVFSVFAPDTPDYQPQNEVYEILSAKTATIHAHKTETSVLASIGEQTISSTPNTPPQKVEYSLDTDRNVVEARPLYIGTLESPESKVDILSRPIIETERPKTVKRDTTQASSKATPKESLQATRTLPASYIAVRDHIEIRSPNKNERLIAKYERTVSVLEQCGTRYFQTLGTYERQNLTAYKSALYAYEAQQKPQDGQNYAINDVSSLSTFSVSGSRENAMLNMQSMGNQLVEKFDRVPLPKKPTRSQCRALQSEIERGSFTIPA